MRQSVELSSKECLELLERQTIGRLAFPTPLGPRIVPLNYIYRGTLLVRVPACSEVGTYAPGAEVAFEVEDIDPEKRIGSSVVVHGTAEVVADGAELCWLKDELDRTTWVGGRADRYVRLRMHDVTGRIVSGGEPQASHTAAG